MVKHPIPTGSRLQPEPNVATSASNAVATPSKLVLQHHSCQEFIYGVLANHSERTGMSLQLLLNSLSLGTSTT
jgi:hypothetical protein